MGRLQGRLCSDVNPSRLKAAPEVDCVCRAGWGSCTSTRCPLAPVEPRRQLSAWPGQSRPRIQRRRPFRTADPLEPLSRAVHPGPLRLHRLAAPERTSPAGAGPPGGGRRRRDQRCAIGFTSRLTAPTYSWRGRPILYSGSPIISLSCAIQPTVRASAKMAVNRLTGMPSALCTMPE